jgi:hypothetical protein
MLRLTPDAVIFDGHHGIRAAAEEGMMVDVLVVGLRVSPCGLSILGLPVR